MKSLKSLLKKRWIWGMGVFVLFTVAFASIFAFRQMGSIRAADEEEEKAPYQFQVPGEGMLDSGANYTMTQREGQIRLFGGIVGESNVTYDWSCSDTQIIDFDPATVSAQSPAVRLRVGNIAGPAAVTVTVIKKDSTGNVVAQETATLNITVDFFISEDFPGTANDTPVYMTKVYETDARKSLVMNYDSSVEVGSAEAGFEILKPVFGDLTSTNATIVSTNDDVVKYDSGKNKIQATGAGPAQLTFSYVVGTKTYSDTIDVYVKPQLTVQDADKPDEPPVIVGGNNLESGVVTVENGDKVGISITDVFRPELAIGDKVIWVISKGEGEDAVLVRDSLGHKGEDAEEATLVYIRSEKAYRVEAKSGIYNLQFYVKGTYSGDFEENKEHPSGVGSINLKTSVKCSYEDKEITLNIGSSYSLADALNMPLDMVKQYFSSAPSKPLYDSVGNISGWEPIVGWEKIIGWNDETRVIEAKALGTVTIRVTPNGNVSMGDIPGLKSLDPIVVTVKVVDTFAMNISATSIAVGATLDLYGIIGSDTFAEDSQFKWTVSDERYVSLSNDIGPITTVTAKQETKKDEPVEISLAWTDNDSVTWVAVCKLTITSSATDFRIIPESASLEVGKSEYLNTNLSGTQNILWLSSDTSIVTVEPQTGNTAAKITATEKTGEVVITAVNRDNDTYATSIITVVAPMTGIKIDQGETYTAKVTNPYLFFSATYEPANATNTEIKWSSSNTSVATIDQNGMITVLSVGFTNIQVTSVANPNVAAWCALTITDDPITAIKTDVTTLNMIKGDTYQVTTTLTPEIPSDRTLTWSSNKTSVATVSNGKITAVGVGTATIMVQGGKATPVLIEVNVRDRITSIAFKETNVSLPVKQTKQLEVIITPDKDVNTNLSFYSSDTSIVTVDAKGMITGISEGKAMITCISEDLGKYQPITCNVEITKEVILATAFTVDPLEKTIVVGEEFEITPIFTPENTLDQRVTYLSLNEEIATVDENGKVVGVMTGETMIQVTAVESRLTALCKVTVEQAVQFSLSPSEREIALGKSFKITKVVEPNNVNKSAIWQTSNSKIASISSTGKVTGKKLGTCTITCTLKRYNQSATCRVKVARLNSTVKLDKTSIRMNVGSTYRLKKTVWSNNSTTPSVKFTSQNKKIASVGASSGKITAKKVGSTVITAKTQDEVRATARCRVIVIRRATSISLNKTYAICTIGRTIKLKATVKPDNASIKKVKWTSSDPNIASITGSGKITGYAEGDVYITATTTDGSNKSAKCYVKVTESVPATNVMVAQQSLTLKQGNTTMLAYTILPNNHTDEIQMASDNKKVCTVTNKGKVTAVGTGMATITITTTSGTVATVEVNVVSLNKSSVRMRQYDTETLMVMGTEDNITWYSANNRIATVTNGKVTAKGTGTTYIYAFVNGCKMGCKITVVSVNNTQR